MTTLHLRRLERFDFRFVHRDRKEIEGFTAPSCGCAIGEIPFVFPKTFRICEQSVIRKGKEYLYARETIGPFFGISTFESLHLFVPKMQIPEKFGGIKLRESATKEQVAANIRAFVALQRRALGRKGKGKL